METLFRFGQIRAPHVAAHQVEALSLTTRSPFQQALAAAVGTPGQRNRQKALAETFAGGHAELLRGTRGARPTPALGYTQHPKTARTASWIPHGSEHRFVP